MAKTPEPFLPVYIDKNVHAEKRSVNFTGSLVLIWTT